MAQQGGLCVGVHGGGGPRLGPGRGRARDELRRVRQREAGRQRQHLAVPEDDGLRRLREAGGQAGGPGDSRGVSPPSRPARPPATPPATLPAEAEGAMAADTVDPGLHELRGEGLRGHQGDAVLWAGPGVDVEAQVQHVRTPACPQSCSWHPAPEQPRLPDRGFWGPGASRLCLWPSLHPPRDRPPSPQPQEQDWLGRCWVNAVHKRGFCQLPRHESAVTNTRPCGGSKNPAVPTREAVRPASHVHLPHGAGTGAPRPIHRGKLPDGQGKRRLRAGRLPGGLRGVLAGKHAPRPRGTSVGSRPRPCWTHRRSPRGRPGAAEPVPVSSAGSACAALGSGPWRGLPLRLGAVCRSTKTARFSKAGEANTTDRSAPQRAHGVRPASRE